VRDRQIDRRTFLASTGAVVAAGALRGSIATTGRSRASAIVNGLRNVNRGKVLGAGDSGFLTAAHVYNHRFDSILPTAVVLAAGVDDIQATIDYAVGHGIPLRARSGGHSYAGYSTVAGGIVLDLHNLRSISVNRGAGTATVGAGAQLIDVYAGLAKHGATIPAGSCPSVGVSGVTLGGGVGCAGRAFGLTMDNLKSARITTADGLTQTVSASSNPDLYWGIRGGGGGNFGVVSEFTYKVHPMPATALFFSVSWPWSSAAEALIAWLKWAPHTHDYATSIFHLNSNGTVSISGQFIGTDGGLGAIWRPMLNIPGAQPYSVRLGYLQLQLLLAGCAGESVVSCHTVGAAPGGTMPRDSFFAKSDYIAKVPSDAAAHALVDAAARGSGAVLFDAYGGKINTVAPGDTAFVHRDQLCAMQYLTYTGDTSWLNSTWKLMRAHTSGQAYQNYIDHSLSGWRQAYYAGNYSRLTALQRDVDPQHFFDFPQAIGR
jgi:FAD binding domain/Berberine and berberine like